MKKNRIAAFAAAMTILAGAGDLHAQLIPMYMQSLLSDDSEIQWEQPYYSYGGHILTDIDYYYGTKPSDAEHLCKIVYKYDSQGEGVYMDQPYATVTDSVTGKTTVKRYVYEASDTCLAYIFYKQDKDGNWYSDDTEKYNYWHGFTTELVEFYWSSKFNELLSPRSIKSEYDNQGRPTVTLQYNNGVREKKTEYIHDSETSVILTEYWWNSEKGEWINPARHRESYNSDWSQLLFRDDYRLAGSEWVLSKHTCYEYNDNKKVAEWSLTYLEDGSVNGQRKENVQDSLERVTHQATYVLGSLEPLEWVGESRTDYEYSSYDTRGRKPTVITYVWDSIGFCWEPSHVETIELDEHGSVIYSGGANWDGNRWNIEGPRYEYKYIYDSEGNKYPTMSIEYNTDPDGYIGILTFTDYDEHFCIESQFVYGLDSLFNYNVLDWRSTDKKYNAAGLPDSVILMHKDSLETLNVYTYGIGPEDNSTREIYNRKDGAWVPSKRILYRLSEQGDTLFTEYYTGLADGTWQPKSRYLAEYDSEGRLIMDAYYNWNSKRQYFKGASKWEDIYDEQGTKLGYAVYLWDDYYGTDTWYGLQYNLQMRNETSYGYDIVKLDYGWNYDECSWYLRSCDSLQFHINELGNLAELSSMYRYWESYTVESPRMEYDRFVFNYTVPTSVPDVPAATLNDYISVQDCTVSVTAPDGGLINILSVDGTAAASGTGTLTATLPAGLYIVRTATLSAAILLR